MPLPDVRSALRTARWMFAARDRSIGRRLARAGVARSSVRFLDGGRFAIDDLRITGVRDRHLFLCESMPRLRSLRHEAGARLSIDSGDQTVHVAISGLDVIIESEEEILILHEIFAAHAYAQRIARPSVVWDIGCNVGFAALYFALSSEVVHVEAFEPVAPTVAQAARNLALNPAVAEKITLHDFGIAAANRTDMFAYHGAWKGHTGVAGTLGHVVGQGRLDPADIRTQPVELRSACDVLDAIQTAHPGVDVVAKIDCEGAEYEIVDALANAGRLRDLDAVMIEWHTHGAERIARLLREARFDVESQIDPSGLAGVVRGKRQP